MYHYFMNNREKFLEHYHQQAIVETAYSTIKGKFGDSLRSKSYAGQANEALCHNLCVSVQAMHELGIEPAFSFYPQRFNEREGEDADMFKKALGSVAGRRLTYSELTGKITSGQQHATLVSCSEFWPA